MRRECTKLFYIADCQFDSSKFNSSYTQWTFSFSFILPDTQLTYLRTWGIDVYIHSVLYHITSPCILRINHSTKTKQCTLPSANTRPLLLPLPYTYFVQHCSVSPVFRLTCYLRSWNVAAPRNATPQAASRRFRRRCSSCSTMFCWFLSASGHLLLT